jgi:hypothetical protein
LPEQEELVAEQQATAADAAKLMGRWRNGAPALPASRPGVRRHSGDEYCFIPSLSGRRWLSEFRSLPS